MSNLRQKVTFLFSLIGSLPCCLKIEVVLPRRCDGEVREDTWTSALASSGLDLDYEA